mmetsp:Transcript_7916/g.28113  ORF Transcript_7916/g.28113 Transcript_7916/m.28113 type:complete len:354 (-) Transcript_7916:474-1535(-)
MPAYAAPRAGSRSTTPESMTGRTSPASSSSSSVLSRRSATTTPPPAPAPAPPTATAATPPPSPAALPLALAPPLALPAPDPLPSTLVSLPRLLSSTSASLTEPVRRAALMSWLTLTAESGAMRSANGRPMISLRASPVFVGHTSSTFTTWSSPSSHRRSPDSGRPPVTSVPGVKLTGAALPSTGAHERAPAGACASHGWHSACAIVYRRVGSTVSSPATRSRAAAETFSHPEPNSNIPDRMRDSRGGPCTPTCSNGYRRDRSRYMRTPTDQQSVGGPYVRLGSARAHSSSGAKYCGVPTTDCAVECAPACLLSPKSTSFMMPMSPDPSSGPGRGCTSTFSAFTSRCSTPTECR